MRGGGGGEGGLGRRRSSPELVLSVSMAANRDEKYLHCKTQQKSFFLYFSEDFFFTFDSIL